MARIRQIEIKHFRGIDKLVWKPSPGINCLIGPGDNCKSTVLDAIDLCLSPRRTAQFSDADFHHLDTNTPIEISITLGALPDSLKNFDTYGLYLRGYRGETGELLDEPIAGGETVLTLRVSVAADLEPMWTLVSKRAEAEGVQRGLAWADRVRIAPARIGVMARHHLAWKRGSVLTRLSEETAAATLPALAKASREARAAMGEEAGLQLEETLEIVTRTANDLGISVGKSAKAMLDIESVSFSGGTISLHDERGVPLSGLGTGSARLLVSGLQREAAANAPMVLIDELEYGLEPHRVIRLVGSLGAKEAQLPLQVFMTTHSPVVVRELSGSQLFVMRRDGNDCLAKLVGIESDIQSCARLYPEAFLASSVIACEGASEVGFIRGLDLHRVSNGRVSISAVGTYPVDCHGSHPDNAINRALAFQKLGYRTAAFFDADLTPSEDVQRSYLGAGGKVFSWIEERCLEEQLFQCLSESAILNLLEYAEELHGTDTIDAHISTASQGKLNLATIREECEDELSVETADILTIAATYKKKGWFKSVTSMEHVAREIVGPDLPNSGGDLAKKIEELFSWAVDGG
jgi:hypothetical protein